MDARAARRRLQAVLQQTRRLGVDDAELDQDGDAVDAATAHGEFELTALRAAWLVARRQCALAALEQLDVGTYGRCVDCEEPIAAARLIAIPEAERCTRCQERHERQDA